MNTNAIVCLYVLYVKIYSKIHKHLLTNHTNGIIIIKHNFN